MLIGENIFIILLNFQKIYQHLLKHQEASLKNFWELDMLHMLFLLNSYFSFEKTKVNCSTSFIKRNEIIIDTKTFSQKKLSFFIKFITLSLDIHHAKLRYRYHDPKELDCP